MEKKRAESTFVMSVSRSDEASWDHVPSPLSVQSTAGTETVSEAAVVSSIAVPSYGS
jgi:hypothetical protein